MLTACREITQFKLSKTYLTDTAKNQNVIIHNFHFHLSSPAKSPVKKRTAKVRKPISRRTASKNRSAFNAAGMKRLDEKFADTEDYDDDRVPTPPGKRRVAFRGQYIFVTDDEEEYSEVGFF